MALKYSPDEGGAPVVSAGGVGELAERIMARARESGVPVYEDPELAALLGRVEVGGEIPVELYRAVAEVLAFIYTTEKNLEEKVN